MPLLPTPTGAASPRGSAVPLPHGGVGSLNDAPYLDPSGLLWITRTKVCPDCGTTFDRWSPGASYRRKDGARHGSAYCRACANRRVLQNFRVVVGSKRCRSCGATFQVTRGMNYQKQYGTRTLHYCSQACHADSKRKWSSKTEKQREKKRRYRARLRAAGRPIK